MTEFQRLFLVQGRSDYLVFELFRKDPKLPVCHALHYLQKSVPLAESIEDLAPALSPDHPNPEYPWPRMEPLYAPVEHQFQIWQNLTTRREGLEFIKLVERLFAAAETFI